MPPKPRLRLRGPLIAPPAKLLPSSSQANFHPRPAGQLRCAHSAPVAPLRRTPAARATAAAVAPSARRHAARVVVAGALEKKQTPQHESSPAGPLLPCSAAWGPRAQLKPGGITRPAAGLLACLPACLLLHPARQSKPPPSHDRAGGSPSILHQVPAGRPASSPSPACRSLALPSLPRVTVSLIKLLSPRVLGQMRFSQASRRAFPCHAMPCHAMPDVYLNPRPTPIAPRHMSAH